MISKRKYTDTLVSLELVLSYMDNHLSNIDAHLQKQNDTIFEECKARIRNTNDLKWIKRIGGCLLGSGGVTAGILKLLEVY